LRDPHWRAAMQEEYDALQRNRTWELVPPPPRANVITGKWVFKHKLGPDGKLERYKARWVVRGFRQRAGVDFTDTFAPVVKPGTIRTVLHLAASRAWPVHQMDVSNAFLHGHLSEQVYCQQPIGFVDADHPDHVCLLSRSLYGLKQAPRAWYQRIAAFLHQLGFRSTRSDASLFVYRHGTDTAYLLLYVDDIILTACTDGLLRQLTDRLRAEFALKDLGPLHYFLGIEVVRRADGFFLHQRKYAHELLERAGMLNCHPAPTPVDTKAKLSASDGSPASDAPFYRSIVGALQYLTLTRPELQYAVQQVCLHMHAPRDAHWSAVKRILRYICGTMDFGLSLHASPASPSTDIVAYSDADWAGCPDTRRSTSGYCVYLGSSLVSWSSKRQPTVSRSSAEAEYRAVANAVAECTWLRQLLSELSCPVDKATVVFCDNVSAVYLSANPVHHRRTKHIELDIHFVREQVALGHVRVLHVPTSQQFADIMTKGLPSTTFPEFRSSLCVCPDPSTAGGC
jgi:histone deacetylase 1/2